MKGSNVLALGYDEGTVMIKMGNDQPAMSMDNSGKVVYALGCKPPVVGESGAEDSTEGHER